jgi:hypothetical protein
MSKMLLSEFVRYTEFEDVFFEGIYDDPWGKETAKPNAREGKLGPETIKGPLPLLPYNPQPAAPTQPVQQLQPGQQIELNQPAPVADPAKEALVNFIVNQLPNVRLDVNRKTLAELVADNDNNVATTLANPKMIDFARMLDRNVRGWMGTLKGPMQQQMMQLLAPFQNNVTQLLKTVLPDVTAKLKGINQNG